MKAAESGVQPAPLGIERVDISPKHDEGVLKVIEPEGRGTEMPMTGNRVLVHYTGLLLDGTKFASSPDCKDKFSFDLGKGIIPWAHEAQSQFPAKEEGPVCFLYLQKGEVIKARDVAIATLKVGEAFSLTCKPEYAHGWAGSPRQTASNATLVFEVEWCEFKGAT